MKLYNTFIICIIVLITFCVYPARSQDTVFERKKNERYFNSVKGMPILVPIPMVAYMAGLSAGYECYLGKHHALELCGYYFFKSDEMGNKYRNFSIMLGYKFFSRSEDERFNNFWAGAYFSYYEEYQVFTDGGGVESQHYNYGIGASVGKKINLSKNKRWYIDLGFGMTFFKRFYKPLLSDVNWDDKFEGNKVIPRPVLQFGWKF